jgi:succinate dehydrogenase / fumarate reductase, cytochrome b subunit
MYKGREGQWAFFLHRLSGIAILLYLILHTVSIGSTMLGEQVYTAVHKVYELAPFRLGLVGVAGAVAYHAFNGLRIVLMDFTDWGVKYQRQLWYAALVLAGLFMLLTLYANLPRLLPSVFTYQMPWEIYGN